MKSFANLVNHPNPTKEMLIEHLQEYVESGSPISSRIVTRVIKKVSFTLTPGDKDQLKNLAEVGAKKVATQGGSRQYLAIKQILSC
jgi:hypothetical protein